MSDSICRDWKRPPKIGSSSCPFLLNFSLFYQISEAKLKRNIGLYTIKCVGGHHDVSHETAHLYLDKKYITHR
jgi:hypothetical protein